MAEGELSPGPGWFAVQCAGAPDALRTRAAEYVDRRSEAEAGLRLAGAATDALATALAGGGDRRVALDLLAADALVTLALRACAESDPASLGAFAASLRHAGPPLR